LHYPHRKIDFVQVCGVAWHHAFRTRDDWEHLARNVGHLRRAVAYGDGVDAQLLQHVFHGTMREAGVKLAVISVQEPSKHLHIKETVKETVTVMYKE
jgi:hypothetical protein